MTREEAIEILHNIKADNLNLDDAYTKDKYDALEIAIGDMEKQIPKKPKPIDWERYIGVVRNAEYLRNKSWCPNCGADIRCGQYCNRCGQALDWSDKE